MRYIMVYSTLIAMLWSSIAYNSYAAQHYSSHHPFTQSNKIAQITSPFFCATVALGIAASGYMLYQHLQNKRLQQQNTYFTERYDQSVHKLSQFIAQQNNNLETVLGIINEANSSENLAYVYLDYQKRICGFITCQQSINTQESHSIKRFQIDFHHTNKKQIANRFLEYALKELYRLDLEQNKEQQNVFCITCIHTDSSLKKFFQGNGFLFESHSSTLLKGTLSTTIYRIINNITIKET